MACLFRLNPSTNLSPFYTFSCNGSCESERVNDLAVIDAVDFKTLFRSLVQRIERVYSLKVNVGPVIGSYTGQFDGKELWVDLEKDAEEAVFILVHLFGHTVQWNIDEKLRVLGLANSGVTEADLPRIYEYEREASQIGLALIEKTGEFGLARWLTDRFGADWKF